MRVVEIAALPNGGHRNQTSSGLSAVPAGWAVVPEEMGTANFPFGDLTVENVDGVPTVTGWVPGVVPKPEAPEETDGDITAAQLAAAIQEGVDSV